MVRRFVIASGFVGASLLVLGSCLLKGADFRGHVLGIENRAANNHPYCPTPYSHPAKVHPLLGEHIAASFLFQVEDEHDKEDARIYGEGISEQFLKVSSTEVVNVVPTHIHLAVCGSDLIVIDENSKKVIAETPAGRKPVSVSLMPEGSGWWCTRNTSRLDLCTRVASDCTYLSRPVTSQPCEPTQSVFCSSIRFSREPDADHVMCQRTTVSCTNARTHMLRVGGIREISDCEQR